MSWVLKGVGFHQADRGEQYGRKWEQLGRGGGGAGERGGGAQRADASAKAF